MNKDYWEKIIKLLLDKKKSTWAAHVLSCNIDILDEILNDSDKKIIIKNCLKSYAVDLSSQPYLDEILSQFSVVELISVYKELEIKPLEIAGALMWLIEDMDPELKIFTSKILE